VRRDEGAIARLRREGNDGSVEGTLADGELEGGSEMDTFEM